jgi:hypothetical protein
MNQHKLERFKELGASIEYWADMLLNRTSDDRQMAQGILPKLEREYAELQKELYERH